MRRDQLFSDAFSLRFVRGFLVNIAFKCIVNGEPTMSLGGADMQQGAVTYSRSLPERALFNFGSVHLLSLLFSKCSYCKAYLERVSTNTVYNELLLRNEVAGPGS